jgi:uncharacterized membrane protein YhaH (DUF805 family)
MVSAVAMNTDKIVLVVFALFWFALFILSRRFRWDERSYEQFKDWRIMWLWLDVFGVPKTRENCLRFSFAVWIAMLVLLSVFTIAALRFGD